MMLNAFIRRKDDESAGMVFGDSHTNHSSAPLLTLESNPWPDYMPTYVSVLLPYAGQDAPEVLADVTESKAGGINAWQLDLNW